MRCVALKISFTKFFSVLQIKTYSLFTYVAITCYFCVIHSTGTFFRCVKKYTILAGKRSLGKNCQRFYVLLLPLTIGLYPERTAVVLELLLSTEKYDPEIIALSSKFSF